MELSQLTKNIPISKWLGFRRVAFKILARSGGQDLWRKDMASHIENGWEID
jgi:hypothetical protein